MENKEEFWHAVETIHYFINDPELIDIRINQNKSIAFSEYTAVMNEFESTRIDLHERFLHGH